MKGFLAVVNQVKNFNDAGDKKPINIEGLPSGSVAFESPHGFIEVIVVNDENTEGIIIDARGADLVKKLANSVVFFQW